MPLDPQWDYRFPLRKQYPEDNYGCTRLMMKSMLEEEGVFINVVTFPAPCLRENEEIPAAVAVWELGCNMEKDYLVPPTSGAKTRRDANPARMAAFDDALQAAKKSYFDSKYRTHHLHLRVLATHPDFQRRGAGSALCKWGMEQARERKEPVTLFSSPMGQQLYSYLGFDYVGTVPVQAPGEPEKLNIGAMIYSDEAPKKAQ